MNIKFKILIVLSFNFMLTKDLYCQPDSLASFFYIENMPLFEDKDPSKSFTEYIKEQIDISEIERYDSISGRIIIQFTIDSNGYVVEPLILRGLNETVDSVALAIVVNSPKWTPGTQRGKNISVPFTFPIYINMDDPSETTNRKRKKDK